MDTMQFASFCSEYEAKSMSVPSLAFLWKPSGCWLVLIAHFHVEASEHKYPLHHPPNSSNNKI